MSVLENKLNVFKDDKHTTNQISKAITTTIQIVNLFQKQGINFIVPNSIKWNWIGKQVHMDANLLKSYAIDTFNWLAENHKCSKQYCVPYNKTFYNLRKSGYVAVFLSKARTNAFLLKLKIAKQKQHNNQLTLEDDDHTYHSLNVNFATKHVFTRYCFSKKLTMADFK